MYTVEIGRESEVEETMRESEVDETEPELELKLLTLVCAEQMFIFITV